MSKAYPSYHPEMPQNPGIRPDTTRPNAPIPAPPVTPLGNPMTSPTPRAPIPTIRPQPGAPQPQPIRPLTPK